MTVKRNLFGSTTTTTTQGWNAKARGRRNKHSPSRDLMDVSPVKDKMQMSPSKKVSRTRAQDSLDGVTQGQVALVKFRSYPGANSARALGRVLRANKERFGVRSPLNFATLELEKPHKVDAVQEAAEVAQALQLASEYITAGMTNKDMKRMLELMSVGITRYMKAEVVGRCPNGNIQVIDLELEEADPGFQAMLPCHNGNVEETRVTVRSIEGYGVSKFHRQINPHNVDSVLVDNLNLVVNK